MVGAGTIGASWIACFLAHGFDVTAHDPSDAAMARIEAMVARSWPALERFGLAAGASRDRLTLCSDLSTTVADADFIQENGPERLELKRGLFEQLGRYARADAIIASSSSGITPSEYQDACANPDRVVLGHPFNPPHLIPLVEVCAGKLTSQATVDRTLAFYRSIGKHPILLRREIRGHIANRLQAAVWREAFSLVSSGVASAQDVDAAISHGLGLRWALLGPYMNLHLAGGAGGSAHAFDLLAGPMQQWWADMHDVTLDPATIATLVAAGEAMVAEHDIDAVVTQRDAMLVELVKRKRESDLP
ncbi:3-hydroxyacyl-CoA dehydrogenase NAD-binding domain-containing protein [soil metagenome]